MNAHTASLRNIVQCPSSEVHLKCVQSSSSSQIQQGPDEGEGGANTHTTSMRNIVMPTCEDEEQTVPELDRQTSQSSCVQPGPELDVPTSQASNV